MRLMVSTFTDVIAVLGHVTIRPGDVVDFDQPVGRGTLADALGAHVAGFADAPAGPSVAVDVHDDKPARRKSATQQE